MLLFIAVMSVVGGVFSFKVKKLGTRDYCYSITNIQPAVGDCTLIFSNGIARPLSSEEFKAYYTVTYNTLLCEDATCPNIGAIDFNE